MNLVLAVPLAVRLALLFAGGALAGGLVNLAVYRLACRQRSISPWSAAPDGAPPRRRTDRIPIVGWLGLRRESALHGAGFWVRPLLVELLLGAGCAWLYWWEIGRQGLLPLNLMRPLQGDLLAALHAQCACHAVLILLMAAASLIDADERTIPDEITVFGTLFGLLAAAAYPWVLLPTVRELPGGQEAIGWLHVTSPHPWPPWLTGFPEFGSLLVGLGCWWLWCVGLMPRTWYSRHGWQRAVQLLCARLTREPAARRLSLVGLVGTAGIAGVWLGGGVHWQGLLSGLVGMAASGGLIWLVRIIGAATLHREAMGFGDVTLMAMVGTLLGWQTGLLIFFIAPLIAIGVGLLTLILHRQREIPYGPFLCLASLLAMVRWADLWRWAEGRIFILGAWVPAILAVCMALLAVLLLAIDFGRRMLAR